MTYAEFAKLAANIKTYFPRDNVLPSDRAMTLWYESLKDLDADAVMTGLKKYVLTNKFPPSISDLRSYAVRPAGKEEISETHAWNLVYQALGNSIGHAEEEFDKLPEVVQRAVHSPGQLREWAKMDIRTVNSVIYSNFLRAYSAAVVRQREDDNMPEYLKELEADIAARLARSRSGDGKIGAGDEGPAHIQGNSSSQIGIEQKDAFLTDETEIAAKMERLREKLYAGRHDDTPHG